MILRPLSLESSDIAKIAVLFHCIQYLFSSLLALITLEDCYQNPERQMDTKSGERLDRTLYESLEEPEESNVQSTHTVNTRYPSAPIESA